MKNFIISFLITAFIVGTIGSGGYLIYENIAIKKEIDKNYKTIENLKIKNRKLILENQKLKKYQY